MLVEPFHANAAAARLNTLRTGRVFVEQAAIWGGGGSGGGDGRRGKSQQQGVGLARLSRTNVWGGNAAEVRQAPTWDVLYPAPPPSHPDRLLTPIQYVPRWGNRKGCLS